MRHSTHNHLYSEQPMITLQELLSLKTDLFTKSNTLLVRHKDSRVEYRDILKDREKLLEYQKYQSRTIFKDADFLISFIGQERRKSLLFGIFKINEVRSIDKGFYYDIEELNICEDLVDRVVVD